MMPFHIFIDGTLVARNLAEPISICPDIFNRSVRNIDRSWFIMGYIEPENNFYGEIDERLTRRGGNKPHLIKLDDNHAIIIFILD